MSGRLDFWSGKYCHEEKRLLPSFLSYHFNVTTSRRPYMTCVKELRQGIINYKNLFLKYDLWFYCKPHFELACYKLKHFFAKVTDKALEVDPEKRVDIRSLINPISECAFREYKNVSWIQKSDCWFSEFLETWLSFWFEVKVFMRVSSKRSTRFANSQPELLQPRRMQ